MSQVASQVETADPDQDLGEPSAFQELTEALKEWMREKGLFWATSATAHFLGLSIAMLVLGAIYVAPKAIGTHPEFEDPGLMEVGPIDNFVVAETPLDPTEIDLSAAPPNVEEQINTTPDDPFQEAGGGASTATAANLPGMAPDLKSLANGVMLKGAGGLGGAPSTGKDVGSGDKGSGFGGRGMGVRNAVLSANGGTKQSERAVAAALNWLARHQNPDGSWSLNEYVARCKDDTCTGSGGKHKSDAAATALALLPFLAAGQTHLTKGPYQATIQRGLYWLSNNQSGDGDLSGVKGHAQMYSHGLCSICMCEAYGLSRDKALGGVAQKALYFIEQAQDPGGGGWRYTPRQAGDTSVVGWQVMALKSGHMAGLTVSTQVLEGAKRFLAAAGNGRGEFGYLADGGGKKPTMTAVGLLCSQYLGAPKTDPIILGGTNYLMNHMPDKRNPSIYYWYYATQVMHNMPGAEWDTWNRAMRKILIDTQDTKGCAAGSWDPTSDHFGREAGRVFQTALSCLTLEVYYRYLPLYKLDENKK